MQAIYLGWGDAKEHDQEVGNQLFDRHASTVRSVEKLADGIRTLTLSADAVTVSLLHDHVLAMENRMNKGLVMRRWDPFFPELFRHADEIQQRIEKRADGVFVEAHSANPYVVQLLYSHADAISDFAARGWDAAREMHALPENTSQELSSGRMPGPFSSAEDLIQRGACAPQMSGRGGCGGGRGGHRHRGNFLTGR